MQKGPIMKCLLISNNKRTVLIQEGDVYKVISTFSPKACVTGAVSKVFKDVKEASKEFVKLSKQEAISESD